MIRTMRMQGLTAALVMAAMAAMAIYAQAQSKYAAGTTEAAVVFGPVTGEIKVETIYAASDKAGAAITVHAWNMVRPVSPSADHTATNIILAVDADDVLAQNDKVVYVHPDGTLDYRTVSAVTATNITLSANLTQAGGAAGRIYELATAGALPFDTAGAAVGTNKYAAFAGTVWRGLGPVRLSIDGTSNTVIQVTGGR